MKNIKFRLWESNFKHMVPFEMITVASPIGFYLSIPLGNEDKIPMQYIGLRDKNGVEVYEGDIVLFPDAFDCSTECGYDWNETMGIGMIQWNDEEIRFDVTKRNSIDMDSLIECFDEVEVIGNIYENPELLEMNVEEFYSSKEYK